MAIVYLARINPSDYNAVRGILHGDLPNTHDEWLKLQLKEQSDYQAAGHSVRYIQVNPDEFARFCYARGSAPHHDWLAEFALKKARGARY